MQWIASVEQVEALKPKIVVASGPYLRFVYGSP
jgi:hypothetical protein